MVVVVMEDLFSWVVLCVRCCAWDRNFVEAGSFLCIPPIVLFFAVVVSQVWPSFLLFFFLSFCYLMAWVVGDGG